MDLGCLGYHAAEKLDAGGWAGTCLLGLRPMGRGSRPEGMDTPHSHINHKLGVPLGRLITVDLNDSHKGRKLLVGVFDGVEMMIQSQMVAGDDWLFQVNFPGGCRYAHGVQAFDSWKYS